MPRALSPQAVEDFRERLIDEAERLFASKGAEAVTIRELAAAVGVSPMTPYRYFKDKDAMLAAVRARAFDRHAQALESAFAKAAPEDRPWALASAYIGFAEENPEAYKLMFDVRQPTMLDHPELVRAASRSYRTMTLQLEGEARAGRLEGDVERIAQVYWAALHGALMLRLSGLFDPAQAKALIVDHLGALDRAFLGAPRKGF